MNRFVSPWPARAPGLVFAAAIGLAAMLIEPYSRGIGMSALPLAIVIGIVLGNSLFPRVAGSTGTGVDYARTMLLRAGIVLFGFRLTFQDILDVGLGGMVIALVVVASVFVLALWLGRLMKMDEETALLIGSGASICGAAAVMAAEPVVKAQASKVSVAVATVVVFGTLGMFLYPFLKTPFGLDAHAYGVYAGSTIHEVAQVVVAGRAVSETAADVAVIEKMIRVILLTPFLLLLSAWMRAKSAGAGGKARLVIPWFAVLFLVVGAFNSLHLLPKPVVDAILLLDTFLLATAMAALGLRTHVGAIRQAGMKPMLLAAILFAYLIFGGLAINLGVTRLLG
ncbi:YeiH family putative sulfate export transporter [Lysobacter pythonis]|uniref:YeiH family putative sulfate export transporter n=1 Tax=Solilutibacter pythonis TaxID=2483112 RepID=A0A3M2HTB9_9GAMM|nr:YeiH family protein [Lysobacter pythonis]RMH89024.1 YeiH family putative sulfate export transporter [Lysobacter pythonis]